MGVGFFFEGLEYLSSKSSGEVLGLFIGVLIAYSFLNISPVWEPPRWWGGGGIGDWELGNKSGGMGGWEWEKGWFAGGLRGLGGMRDSRGNDEVDG